MSTRIIKGGYATVTTEYEVRGLDQYGDAQDVRHYESQGEALAAAPAVLGGEITAWAVEKHVSREPAHLFADPSRYTTIATGGSREALVEGGWVAQEVAS
jgi:hypothetical protein